jgi:hypothetical protein
VFALDEGDVVITFPETLSADSFADLKAYLDVFVKKVQRRSKALSGPSEVLPPRCLAGSRAQAVAPTVGGQLQADIQGRRRREI